MLGIKKIRGESMSPFVSSDDYVITSSFFLSLHINDIIVVKHPIYNKVIKRIKTIDKNGNLWLTGENSGSLSSKKMGLIDKQWVLCKVIYTIKKRR
ncbi:MAG: S24 family peptidase [Cellvibrionaceae bacterium]